MKFSKEYYHSKDVLSLLNVEPDECDDPLVDYFDQASDFEPSEDELSKAPLINTIDSQDLQDIIAEQNYTPFQDGFENKRSLLIKSLGASQISQTLLVSNISCSVDGVKVGQSWFFTSLGLPRSVANLFVTFFF